MLFIFKVSKCSTEFAVMINTCRFDWAQIHFKFAVIHHYFCSLKMNSSTIKHYLYFTDTAVCVCWSPCINPYFLCSGEESFSFQKLQISTTHHPSKCICILYSQKHNFNMTIYVAHTPEDIFHFSTSHFQTRLLQPIINIWMLHFVTQYT